MNEIRGAAEKLRASNRALQKSSHDHGPAIRYQARWFLPLGAHICLCVLASAYSRGTIRPRDASPSSRPCVAHTPRTFTQRTHVLRAYPEQQTKLPLRTHPKSATQHMPRRETRAQNRTYGCNGTAPALPTLLATVPHGVEYLHAECWPQLMSWHRSTVGTWHPHTLEGSRSAGRNSPLASFISFLLDPTVRMDVFSDEAQQRERRCASCEHGTWERGGKGQTALEAMQMLAT